MDESPDSAADVDLGAEPTADDPFADVESDLPEGVEPGVLGGENPTEEPLVEPEEEPLDGFMEDPEPEDPEDEEPLAEPQPDDVLDDGTPVEGSEEPSVDPGSPPDPVEPPSQGKVGDDFRGYIILTPGDTPGTWKEVYDREPGSDEPSRIQARTGKYAVRRAFRDLSDEDGNGKFKLVAIPAKMFQVREVEGESVSMMAIRVD